MLPLLFLAVVTIAQKLPSYLASQVSDVSLTLTSGSPSVLVSATLRTGSESPVQLRMGKCGQEVKQQRLLFQRTLMSDTLLSNTVFLSSTCFMKWLKNNQSQSTRADSAGKSAYCYVLLLQKARVQSSALGSGRTQDPGDLMLLPLKGTCT